MLRCLCENSVCSAVGLLQFVCGHTPNKLRRFQFFNFISLQVKNKLAILNDYQKQTTANIELQLITERGKKRAKEFGNVRTLTTLKFIRSHEYLRAHTHTWIYIYICINVYTHTNTLSGNSRNILANAPDSNIIVSVFKLQSRYYVHFLANTFEKGVISLSCQPRDKEYYYCSYTWMALELSNS